MVMDMSADNLDMLNADEFGSVVVFNGNIISGIYDAAYYELIGGDGSVESTTPAVICRSADVTGIKHQDLVNIDGTDYYVVGVKPDGTGMTEIALELA